MKQIVLVSLTLATFALAANAQWTMQTSEWKGIAVSPISRVRFGNGTHWVERVMHAPLMDRCSDDRFNFALQAKYPEMFRSPQPRYCEKGPAVYDTSNTVLPDMTSATHQHPHMPRVDLTKIPPRGRNTNRPSSSNSDAPDPGRPSPAGGEFRVSCGYSHFAFDDPLVFPNKRGASHLHMFFGNTLASAFSTRESIAKSGNSTCSGGILNRSAYWIPALLDASGAPILPEFSLWYYKSSIIDAALVKTVPFGLSMIVGNASGYSTATNTARYWFSCKSDPHYSYRTPYIRNCNGTDDDLGVSIHFLQCWDGVNLQVSDNKRHMAEPVRSVCPASHPYPIPEISLNVKWNVPAGADTSKWRLSSDTYDRSIPGGYSMHADFMSGWNDETFATIVENCYHARRDCHANNLGNGTRLDGVGFGEVYPAWAHQTLPEDYENQARMPTQPQQKPEPQQKPASGDSAPGNSASGDSAVNSLSSSQYVMDLSLKLSLAVAAIVAFIL